MLMLLIEIVNSTRMHQAEETSRFKLIIYLFLKYTKDTPLCFGLFKFYELLPAVTKTK